MGMGRRSMLKQVGAAGLGAMAVSGVAEADEHGGYGKAFVPPTEEVMREHGIVHRLLMVYNELARRLNREEDVPSLVLNANRLVDGFVENFHEELEEGLIFNEFRRAGSHTDLVKELSKQHRLGRRIAQKAYFLAGKADPMADSTRRQLIRACRIYARMYRAHAAYEDSVLLPALRDIVSEDKFREIGEQYKEQEMERLGSSGLAGTLEELAEIEKTLGIGGLEAFTPSERQWSREA